MKFLTILAFILLVFNNVMNSHQIAIIGCGYVGLMLGGVLVNNGHSIVCVDVDTKKIEKLNNKELPIYEPGLDILLFNPDYRDNIIFTTNMEAIASADIIYICVGTPTDENHNCNCSYLNMAFDKVLEYCQDSASKIICIKSTVPPGTIQKLQDQLNIQNKNAHLIYNPEFMREGTAVHDIYLSNPIVLGGESIEAINAIEQLWKNIVHPDIKTIKTSFATAEMIKYCWNSFSAIRIAYINELAYLCTLFGADIQALTQGVALSEELLPTAAIKPGPGYGGSCLPKDTLAFSKILEARNFSSSMIHQAILSNNEHKKRIIEIMISLLDQKKPHPIVSVLGLSFKANTNDIRYSPAIDFIQALHDLNICVKAYDPEANEDMRQLFPSINYYNSVYEAIQDSDCIVVLTEWDEIKQLDLQRAANLCNNKVVIDMRNLFDPALLGNLGFTYINLGRIN